mgnify:CR=1 FL=1
MEEDDPGSSMRLTWKRATDIKKEWFVFKDEIMQKDACIEYVTDTHQEFKSIMYFVSPEVQDGVSNPLNIDSFQAHKEQSLFGDGFYITKDSM